MTMKCHCESNEMNSQARILYTMKIYFKSDVKTETFRQRKAGKIHYQQS